MAGDAGDDLFSSLPDPPTPGNALATSPRPATHRTLHSRSSDLGVAGKVIGWVNRHRWVTTVLALNLLCLLLSIRHGVGFVLLAGLETLFGLVVVGMLFVPRMYLVKKVVSAIGTAGASMGAGGVAVLFLLGGAKFLRVTSKVGGAGIDAGQLLSAMGVVAAVLVGLAICVGLWHLMGIARVLTVAYVSQLGVLSLLMMFNAPEEERQIASPTSTAARWAPGHTPPRHPSFPSGIGTPYPDRTSQQNRSSHPNRVGSAMHARPRATTADPSRSR